MTADEIRAKFETSKTAAIRYDDWALFVQFEIAAQLAELNARIDQIGTILQDISTKGSE